LQCNSGAARFGYSGLGISHSAINTTKHFILSAMLGKSFDDAQKSKALPIGLGVSLAVILIVIGAISFLPGCRTQSLSSLPTTTESEDQMFTDSHLSLTVNEHFMSEQNALSDWIE
jgi:hypothetical protein